MEKFVEYIVRNLVDNPEAVDVRMHDEENGVLLELRVDPQDVGKVVGKKGRTINAVRTVTMMACARLGCRVRIELVEA